MHTQTARSLVVLALTLATKGAHADEGMWLMNALPKDDIARSLGAPPDDAMLARAQKGALRLANGCSASFVGKEGLVMTNHHCVRPCLEELSTPKRDLLGKPFVAKKRDDELRCARFEVNQLQEITDVTTTVLAAVKGLEGKAYNEKWKSERARIEADCAKGDATVRCDVVTLFDGAVFHLYRQRRHQDVRLVFAPEFAMAAYGGDPDNFSFPRTGFDVAFLRVYDGGKPLSTTDALPFAKSAAKESEPVYVFGHPGGTERNRTVAQLVFQRDTALPWTLLRLAELRGRLDEWMHAKPGREQRGRARLRTVENGLKALRGRHETLATPGFMHARAEQERALRKAASKEGQQAFLDVEEANRRAVALWPDFALLEKQEAFMGDLATFARLLVRARAEGAKPVEQRLPEFTPARMPEVRQQLASTAVVVVEDETALLAWSLHRLRNLKGIAHPLVRALLGTRAPDDVAKELVSKTKLKDTALRVAALDGDVAAWKTLDADPLIVFMRVVDEPARAARAAWESEVEARELRAAEVIAGVRRAARAKGGATLARYPDATFSLRLSYGRVAGTTSAPAMTTVGDLFDRAGDAHPYALPPTWARAKGALARDTPLNISTTNDIIGGNSGSPMVNAKGEIVGLVFDGNLASLGGRYTYDAAENRAVALAKDAILTGLTEVYDADAIAAEIVRAE